MRASTTRARFLPDTSMAEAEPFVALGVSLLAADDVRGKVLEMMHAAALCQLKAVSKALCTDARRELCTRLWCTRLCGEGAGVTDVDVQCLHDAGRLWEVIIAGRQLPQLARLRGFGFVVDVQAVRDADLGAAATRNDGPLGGVALRSCIEGEGDPPRELLLAAVACAASGTVRGVPVQRLREDFAHGAIVGRLDVDRRFLGVIGEELLGLMLHLRSYMWAECGRVTVFSQPPRAPTFAISSQPYRG